MIAGAFQSGPVDRLIQHGLVSVEGEQAFINERGRMALSCALENS
jgi:hypothetical protein